MEPSAIEADKHFWESSSYSPASESIKALKEQLRLCHVASGINPSWITPGPQIVDSLDRDDKPDSAVLQLTLLELQEIEDAVGHFQDTGLPLNRLQAAHFPLPTLSSKLRERSLALPKSQPYFLVRGLKPQCFSKRKNVTIFLGLASHVGTKRAMTKRDPTVMRESLALINTREKGRLTDDILRYSSDHVTDMEAPDDDKDKRYRGPSNRNIGIPFHTEYGEIVSLYTLSRAASGGDFYLADIRDIEARIRSTRPDILKTLGQKWHMSNPNIVSGYETRPLIFNLPTNGPAIQASRTRLCDYTRQRAGLHSLTREQVEALDAVHVAGREVAQRFAFRSGDLVFFNNLRMMYARDGFRDGFEEQNTRKRYVLRLILRDDRNKGWEVPPELDETWRELYEHQDDKELISMTPELVSYKATH